MRLLEVLSKELLAQYVTIYMNRVWRTNDKHMSIRYVIAENRKPRASTAPIHFQWLNKNSHLNIIKDLFQEIPGLVLKDALISITNQVNLFLSVSGLSPHRARPRYIGAFKFPPIKPG